MPLKKPTSTITPVVCHGREGGMGVMHDKYHRPGILSGLSFGKAIEDEKKK